MKKGLRFAVLHRDSFRCRYCGHGAEDGARLEVDHVVPRSAGGRDVMGNLVTACRACNRGKYTKQLERRPDRPVLNWRRMPTGMAPIRAVLLSIYDTLDEAYTARARD